MIDMKKLTTKTINDNYPEIDSNNPLACCGLLTAQNLTSGDAIYDPEALRTVWDMVDGQRTLVKVKGGMVHKNPTEEDLKIRMNKIIERLDEEGRYCAVILLSEAQQECLTVAKQAGFSIVHEFYNPNSGNQCYILAYTRYPTRSDWTSSEYSDDDDE